MFAPCNLNQPKRGIVPTAECNANREDQITYLASSTLSWLVNTERFESKGYGEEAIYRSSKIISNFVDPKTPSYTLTSTKASLLNDEVDLVQLGQSSSRLFYDWYAAEPELLPKT